MEAACGHWKGASSAQCEEGRQLGEGNTYPPKAIVDVPTEFSITQLDGSRKGCPINTSALKSVMANWHISMSIIILIRKQYLKVLHNNDQSKVLSYLDLFLLTKICNSIPAYQLRNKFYPITSGEIPSPIAAIYKTVTGVHTVIGEMIMEGDINLVEDREVSPEYFYSYTDSNRHFLSNNGNACGGPKRKILDLISFLKTGSIELREVDKSNIDISFINKNLESIFSYGLNSTRIDIATMYYNAVNLEHMSMSKISKYGVEEKNKKEYAYFLECMNQTDDDLKTPLNEVRARIGLLEKLLDILIINDVKHVRKKLKKSILENNNSKLLKASMSCTKEYVNALCEVIKHNQYIVENASTCISKLQHDVFQNLGVTEQTQPNNRKILSRIDGAASI